jgi:hypothetical protein
MRWPSLWNLSNAPPRARSSLACARDAAARIAVACGSSLHACSAVVLVIDQPWWRPGGPCRRHRCPGPWWRTEHCARDAARGNGAADMSAPWRRQRHCTFIQTRPLSHASCTVSPPHLQVSLRRRSRRQSLPGSLPAQPLVVATAAPQGARCGNGPAPELLEPTVPSTIAIAMVLSRAGQ